VRTLAGAMILAALACASPAPASTPVADAGSALALPLIAPGESHTLLLAQRVIDRSWGPSEDSVYVEFDVPEWRSEGVAVGLSAAVPGLGQAYAGERRGLWFFLAEAVGWTTELLYRHRGNELRDDSSRLAGSPADSTSAWSFTRWARATQTDPAQIERLYAVDPEAFYDLIGSDPGYAAGWRDGGNGLRDYFKDLRRDSNARLRAARYVAIGVWVNHLVSAADALRAARMHNLPLTPNLGLRLKGGWRGRGPSVMAALERKF
jgi:hypothetical protein